jgi:calcineurin-like phosphoesterase family protein
MSETFLVSDTHFSHRGIVQFLRPDGSKERPWDNIEEMDEALVANWNSVVRPKDKIYHLGDVVINRSALPILARLNGEKILVKGNHDVFRIEEYTPYFKDVRGSATLNDYVMTHIPIHTSAIERWKGNIHGHLHSGRVVKVVQRVRDRDEWEQTIIDPSYLCVSVEQINYTPISLDEAMKRFEEQQ